MAKLTRVLAQVTYSIMGAAFLAAGVSTLLVNTGLLPGAIRDIVLLFSQNNPGFLHVLQEFGTLLVLAGLLTFWFLWHYEQSRAFHWFVTAYWALMALIHWFNVSSPTVSVASGLVNSVPFAVFLTLGLLRERNEGRQQRATEDARPVANQIAEEQHV